MRPQIEHMSIQEPAKFVKQLKNGKKQKIVTFGTSLTAGGTWVRELQNTLDTRYPNLATIVNEGKGAMWSKWGIENIDSRVISQSPDTVFIEFSINDAYLEYKTSVEDAKKNLKSMIAKLLENNRETEIILMVMNPPTGIHLQKRPQIQKYEEMYRYVAHDLKLRLIDFSPSWQSLIHDQPNVWASFVPDGIHPNEHGCSEIVTPSLLRGLGISTSISNNQTGTLRHSI